MGSVSGPSDERKPLDVMTHVKEPTAARKRWILLTDLILGSAAKSDLNFFCQVPRCDPKVLKLHNTKHVCVSKSLY